MSELISDKKVFSLSEVLLSVQKTLLKRYSSAFWVKAEMNKLNYYQHSGHCYPDLVDKSDGKIVAESRAVLWNSDYNRINQKFLTILKEPLKDGIKILFLAKIQFDPKYGLSLQILDIDPSFTLGDLEKEKQETISKLKSEGLYDLNKKRPLPLLPQRIAVISVETSKGYADFLNVISNNPWKYKFFQLLFPSLLQGERAASSIIAQLRRIRKAVKYFDVVAIIRGGGGEVGLSCYNNYDLARFICKFPIPVITGIGHSTNETVAEMVAHTNAITPTKLAEYLIQYFHNFSVPIREAERKIAERSIRLISDEKSALLATSRLFKSAADRVLIDHRYAFGTVTRTIIQQVFMMLYKQQEVLRNTQKETAFHTQLRLNRSKEKLDNLEKNIQILHPANVLKRGYSITLFEGKALANVSSIKNGSEVKTILSDGSFDSIVSQTYINSEKNE